MKVFRRLHETTLARTPSCEAVQFEEQSVWETFLSRSSSSSSSVLTKNQQAQGNKPEAIY